MIRSKIQCYIVSYALLDFKSEENFLQVILFVIHVGGVMKIVRPSQFCLVWSCGAIFSAVLVICWQDIVLYHHSPGVWRQWHAWTSCSNWHSICGIMALSFIQGKYDLICVHYLISYMVEIDDWRILVMSYLNNKFESEQLLVWCDPGLWLYSYCVMVWAQIIAISELLQ